MYWLKDEKLWYVLMPLGKDIQKVWSVFMENDVWSGIFPCFSFATGATLQTTFAVSIIWCLPLLLNVCVIWGIYSLAILCVCVCVSLSVYLSSLFILLLSSSSFLVCVVVKNVKENKSVLRYTVTIVFHPKHSLLTMLWISHWMFYTVVSHLYFMSVLRKN